MDERETMLQALQDALSEWNDRQEALLKKGLDDIVAAVTTNNDALFLTKRGYRKRLTTKRVHLGSPVIHASPNGGGGEDPTELPEAASERSDSIKLPQNIGDKLVQSFGSSSLPERSSQPEEQLQARSPGYWLPAWIAQKANSQNRYAAMAWKFLEDPESSWFASRYARLAPIFILLAVCVSLLQLLGENLLSNATITAVEAGIDALFALEIMIRFCVSPNHWTFFANAYNLIDIVAALPLGLHLGMALDVAPRNDSSLVDARLLGFVPVLRLLRTLRRFSEFHLLLEAFRLALEALPVLLFFYCALLLFFGALIHAIEPLDNVPSLSQALWLTMVSMTTVGYGDVAPVSAEGKFAVASLVVASALYMAVPLGIIGNCFSEVWQNRERILLLHVLRTRFEQWGYGPHDIPLMFEHFDSDQDGALSFIEFKELVLCLNIGLSEGRIAELFNKFDEDGGGTVDAAEFVKALFPSTYHDMYDKDGELRVESDKRWFLPFRRPSITAH